MICIAPCTAPCTTPVPPCTAPLYTTPPYTPLKPYRGLHRLGLGPLRAALGYLARLRAAELLRCDAIPVRVVGLDEAAE